MLLWRLSHLVRSPIFWIHSQEYVCGGPDGGRQHRRGMIGGGVLRITMVRLKARNETPLCVCVCVNMPVSVHTIRQDTNKRIWFELVED